MADAFEIAEQKDAKIAAIQTQLIAYTAAHETAVTAACAAGAAAPIKSQLRRVTFGGANAPTFESLPINGMAAIPCKVTVVGGGFVCAQPASDIHNPNTATAIVAHIPHPRKG